MTLPAIWCNISSIPIGWRPWFLSKGTKCHAKDASIDVKRLYAAHSFLITLAMAVHKLVEQLPHCVAHQRPVLMVLLHLLLYLATALFTKLASIASNFIGGNCSGIFVICQQNIELCLFALRMFLH